MKTSLSGRWGEAEAAAYLRKKGYEIIGANYHTRYGEIDLIARKGDIIAFVEVKLRKSGAFARALENVDAQKQKKLTITASLWLAANPTEMQPRFDVIEIYAPNGINTSPQSILHIENAF